MVCIVLYEMAVWNASACFTLNSAERSCKSLVAAEDHVFPGICKDSSVRESF